MNVDVSETPEPHVTVVVANAPATISSIGPAAATVSTTPIIDVAFLDTRYYPRDNPSGFATGVSNTTLVLRSETGQFYGSNNPSGFITGLNFNTGNFVTVSQTGALTGVFVQKSEVLNFVSMLPSGIETTGILFPQAMTTNSLTISCEMQNDVDNIIYGHGISSVSISGFTVSFADFLTNTGYRLHTRVAI